MMFSISVLCRSRTWAHILPPLLFGLAPKKNLPMEVIKEGKSSGDARVILDDVLMVSPEGLSGRLVLSMENRIDSLA